MNNADQSRFDALLEEVIETLPDHIRALIDEVPVVVLDRPTPRMCDELRADGTMLPEDSPQDICGLHTGTMLTERSVEDTAGLPTQVHLFREGIVSLAGGFDQEDGDDAVFEEIRVTLLHELGHHFGLDEDDLEELGYE